MFTRSQASSGTPPTFNPTRLGGLALQSASQIYDLNLCTARALLKTQARAAAAFGLPDYSTLFESTDEQTRRLFSESTQQVLDTAQHASEVAAEWQRQIGRVIGTQTAQVVETWQQGLREVGVQACDSLNQFCEAVRQNAEEATRSAELLGRSQRDTIHQASEELLLEAKKAAEEAQKALHSTAQTLIQDVETSRAPSSVNKDRPEGTESRSKAPTERASAPAHKQ